VYVVLKVFLGPIKQLTDHKTDIEVLIVSFILYIPLHILICRAHHMVLDYVSVVIELSVQIYPFLHLIFFNKNNNIHE
jgi:hypothetical protein